jgi:hypothetical protein
MVLPLRPEPAMYSTLMVGGAPVCSGNSGPPGAVGARW